MRALASLALLATLAFGCTTPPASTTDAAVEVDVGPDVYFTPPDAYVTDAFVPDDPGPPRAIFVLPPDGTTFFDLPWPTDLRLDAGGHLDLTGFPNPRSTIVDRYLEAVQADQIGYATNGAVYFRFSRRVDTTTLPADPAASMATDASVYLVDIDPDSPDRGTRIPVVVHYQHAPTLYWSERTLAIRPPDGIPLAGGRTYAAVVT